MADMHEELNRRLHHATPTDRIGHWSGDVFHHGVNDPADCDACTEEPTDG